MIRPEAAREQWNRTRLNRFIVDLMLRQGYLGSARAAIRAWALEPYVDAHIFASVVHVDESLRAHRCTEALQWCAENRRRLSKLKSTLEFDLRVQEFIELRREGNVNAAVMYARKHLAPTLAKPPAAAPADAAADDAEAVHAEQYVLVKRCMTLLAYPPDTRCQPYRQLYSVARWSDVRWEFLRTLCAMNALPPVPLLDLVMQSGLSALQTRYCGRGKAGEPTRPAVASSAPSSVSSSFSSSSSSSPTSGDGGRGSASAQFASLHSDVNLACPTCASPFSELGAHLPLSHHVHSNLVCRVTGKHMDEHNPPYVLPNGNAYSAEAVQALADASSNEVYDPKSGEAFQRDQCRKAYIM